MKKIILIALLAFGINANAQITLDHTFYRIYGVQSWVTDLGNNDLKYVFEDSSGFYLYDMNYSLYKHVITPYPLVSLPYYYGVGYITKSLFDCDSTNIEYVLSRNGHDFHIFREDGTLLFYKDSLYAPYSIGGFANGSIWVKPVINTLTGSKLMLYGYGTHNMDSVYIYSLCGSLPENVPSELYSDSYVKVYPNPNNGIINFEFNLPNNIEKFKLTILNSAIKKVDETIVTSNKFQLDLNSKSLSSGMYFFNLSTDKRIYQTGKFIISK